MEVLIEREERVKVDHKHKFNETNYILNEPFEVLHVGEKRFNCFIHNYSRSGMCCEVSGKLASEYIVKGESCSFILNLKQYIYNIVWIQKMEDKTVVGLKYVCLLD